MFHEKKRAQMFMNSSKLQCYLKDQVANADPSMEGPQTPCNRKILRSGEIP
jgi:hypothetical protein